MQSVSHSFLRQPRSFRISTLQQRRFYARPTSSAPSFQTFDRRVKCLQKDRAAANVRASREVDYLRDEVASRLCERFLDINRHFEHVLDLGANACNVARALIKPVADPSSPSNPPSAPSMRLSRLTAVDSSQAMLYRDSDLPFNKEISLKREIIPDEELLPYDANTYDAVVSSLSMHWINDLPSVLAQVNNILKPDAPLLAAMLGGDTLYELRSTLQLASVERRGGLSPHVSPLVDVRDVGGLLTKAGFQLLTVDIDDIVIDYPSIFALMTDLQHMGEANAVLSRELGSISRDVLLAADAIYKELYGSADGTIPATFRVINMIGWKAGQGQSKPLPRGSGEISIKAVLEG